MGRVEGELAEPGEHVEVRRIAREQLVAGSMSQRLRALDRVALARAMMASPRVGDDPYAALRYALQADPACAEAQQALEELRGAQAARSATRRR